MFIYTRTKIRVLPYREDKNLNSVIEKVKINKKIMRRKI